MSWVDRISKDLEIFMGDGEVFKPEYLNASKETEWNTTTFNFPGVDGSLVKRRERKGTIYNLELYLVGEDNLDVSDDFEESAKDKRHWHLRHPLYGDQRVQPLSIKRSDASANVTKFNIRCQETILGVFPKGLRNPVDELEESNQAIKLTAIEDFNATVTRFDPSDAQFLTEQVDYLSETTFKVIDDDNQWSEYQNLVKKAYGDIANNKERAIQSIQDMANYPAKLLNPIKTRLFLFQTQVKTTAQAISELPNPLSVNERIFMEIINGAITAASMVAAANPFNSLDYETKNQVTDTISVLVDIWNDYVELVDNNQLINPVETDQYIANSNTMIQRQDQFNLAIGSLNEIAEDAKTEFGVVLKEDSNVVLLTHRFYGLDNEDENLAFFDRTNNIGLNETLLMKKGRKVVYYI